MLVKYHCKITEEKEHKNNIRKIRPVVSLCCKKKCILECLSLDIKTKWDLNLFGLKNAFFLNLGKKFTNWALYTPEAHDDMSLCFSPGDLNFDWFKKWKRF